jgi:hypothetical protein
MRNIYFYLHLLIIPILIILILIPVKILRYIFFLPALIPFIWLIYDGCPISLLHRNDDNDNRFLQDFFDLFNINISIENSIRISCCGIVSVIVLSTFRIMWEYGVYRK